jgi:phosphoglycolate phosphatase
LLDTAPDMVGALNTLRREAGRAPLPYDLVRAAVSHGAARVVQTGFPEAVDAEMPLLQARFLEIYRASLSVGTRLFPGMDEVLEQLCRRRLETGIVTNKPAWLTEPLLEQLQLRSRFECVISGDTLPERKPHPLPLTHAAKLIGVSPGQCVYVGDAERDVQAAHAAGMPALVANYGYLHAGEDSAAWDGDGYLEQPLDLLNWLDASGRA